MQVKIFVNGKTVEIHAGATLAGAIAAQPTDRGRVVAERNGVIVPAEHWPSTVLQPADRLEIVTFVGGG